MVALAASARSRSPRGRRTSTSATTSASPARSSRRAAASCRCSRTWADRREGAAAAAEHATRALSYSEDRGSGSATSTSSCAPDAREHGRACAPTVVQSLRQTFDARGFIEVETPMLQSAARRGVGAAVRRRTRTRSTSTLFLRIAPELFLKRARRRRHRAGLRDQPQLPQRGRRLHAQPRVRDARGLRGLRRLQRDRRPDPGAGPGGGAVAVARLAARAAWADGTEYDLGGEWDQRHDVRLAVRGASGEEITPETSVDRLRELVDKAGLSTPRRTRSTASSSRSCGSTTSSTTLTAADVRAWTSRSTPARSCASHRSKPGVVEKWDLYVRGFELATGYSELVDPVIQRERFVEQAQARAPAATSRRCASTRTSCGRWSTACRRSGGMGMGIDRLLMALTGLGIRETILLPAGQARGLSG